ncbi:MAG: pyruvate:ferredoxin (flavodoxin) oxidoreductase [Planctomycetota bacterium]
MPTTITLDGNEAVARVAYRLSEVLSIYPITPASPMGEWADQWASHGQRNLWGTVPTVVEMQSEGGAAGAVHGALQIGTLASTFTASQGLLLMLPNLYKIAGELTPAVIHVAARSLATHALSIFCDHGDVMSARSTGWAILGSASVQEAQDLAAIAHVATLEARVPFLHFFDGFRTSHEIASVHPIEDDILRALVDEERIREHRARGLSPDRPVLRGTAQNPDVFFQAREAQNGFYRACPGIVQRAMDRFAELTGRSYRLFEYFGAEDAERVIVAMGSSTETIFETVRALEARGEKVGAVRVRLYRPFDTEALLSVLPETTRRIAVLDRTKEPGAPLEPLALDIEAALSLAGSRFRARPTVSGGRYGLSSKEFTPAMVRAVFEALTLEQPPRELTVGIEDDVTELSLPVDTSFQLAAGSTTEAVFYGLGSDGTVGANKNTIKILGEETDHFVQAYFVYDSKKAGSTTVSHLRFSSDPIHAPYCIERPHCVACHQPQFLEDESLLEGIRDEGIFLLNSPEPKEALFVSLPGHVQEALLEKRLRFFAIDASRIARECGLGGRLNTVMQAAFFTATELLPHETARAAIVASIEKSYGKKGQELVRRNVEALDRGFAELARLDVPSDRKVSGRAVALKSFAGAEPFVANVLAEVIAGRGESLPVSRMPVDGTFPTGTARFEKRAIATEVPVWDEEVCIQCGKCAFVCPHATIRAKVVTEPALVGAPDSFRSAAARDKAWGDQRFTIQVAPDDCTGCGICVDVCPARNKSETRLKAINMTPVDPIREEMRAHWDHFSSLPEVDRREINRQRIPQQQLMQPLFEYSGACAGCGETPYLKLMSQLFGDRAVIANATGCSSIYGGNLPTTPWAKDASGRGPAWSNSLFEDNAEFGLGFRLALDHRRRVALEMLEALEDDLGAETVVALRDAPSQDEADIHDQRERVAALKERLAVLDRPAAQRLLELADDLVPRSVWIVGGDGWAYDIGYGGLDHVLASGADVNILVLDTGVYSNTGGQTSKATPRAAVAKFSAGGKGSRAKDLGLMAMSYGNVYVASVAMGAKDEHTLKVFLEAERHKGPSLIIAYSHCIAHGIPMNTAMQNQKLAVGTGEWLLYRFDPSREANGESPLQLDCKPPDKRVAEFFHREGRFRMLQHIDPERAKMLQREAQSDIDHRRRLYEVLAEFHDPRAKDAQSSKGEEK